MVDVLDKWDWKFDPGEGCIVSGAYHMLSNLEQVDRSDISNII